MACPTAVNEFLSGTELVTQVPLQNCYTNTFTFTAKFFHFATTMLLFLLQVRITFVTTFTVYVTTFHFITGATYIIPLRK